MTDLPRSEPTRQGGLERLKSFLPLATSAYSSRHGYDLGSSDRSNISLLSPYLATRTLGEWEVGGAVLEHHRLTQAERFLEAILWRTYWKGWLESRPQVWREYLRLATEAELFWSQKEPYRRALSGTTGIPAFDLWSQELTQHGYLHHRARQWYASVWLFELRLPWALGALHFYRHLIDGDAASNTLNWRRVAGLQTQGKRFLIPAGEVHKYTEGRLELSSGFEGKTPAPRLGSTPPSSRIVKLSERPSEKLGSPYAILATPEDLSPEVGPLADYTPAVCLILGDESTDGPTRFSSTVSRYRGALVADAALRLKERFGVPVLTLAFDTGVELAQRISQALIEYGCRDLIYYQPSVGRFAELMEDAVQHWATQQNNLRLFPLRRRWDDTLYPHAQKSFHSFKKAALPKALRSLVSSQT